MRGASEGQGLGNKFLGNIRETSAIVQVVRAFSDPNVMHVEGKVDPKDDIETINTELILADLQTIEGRLKKLEGEAKRDPKTFGPVMAAVTQARKILDDGKILYGSGLDLESLQDLQLLTAKPFIYVFNLDEADLSNDELQKQLAGMVAPARAIFLCAQVEAELGPQAEDGPRAAAQVARVALGNLHQAGEGE